MEKMTRTGSIICALLAVLFFSTGGLCIKWVPFQALHVAGLRSFIAAIFLGVYLGYRGELPTISKISVIGWIAVFSYVAMITSYVFAMKMTTAANAIFLQYTMPAWVLAGGAIWLKERITLSRVIVILLSLGGMLLFFLDELRPEQWTGNIVALFSGFAFALLTLALRRVRDQHPLDAIFIGNSVTAIIILPLAFLIDADQFTLLGATKVLGALLWLGTFQIGVAYLFFVAALKGLPAIEVAILSLIEPILNPLLVYLVISETPGFWALIGGAIILFSVLFRAIFTKETEGANDIAAENNVE